MVIAEKKVTVAEFVPKVRRILCQQSLLISGEEQRQAGTRRFTNIYIQSIPKAWTEAKLREVFEEIGPINSIFLPMEDDGTNKGFGFANFPDPEHAAKVKFEVFFQYKTHSWKHRFSKLLEISDNNHIFTVQNVIKLNQKSWRLCHVFVKYFR